MRRTSSAFFLAAAFLFGAPAQAGFQEGFDAFRNSDYSAAMAELLPAAERGDAGAAILVGILSANGYGLDGPDFDQAKHWFETAAVAGPTPVMVVKGALMGMRRKADQERDGCRTNRRRLGAFRRRCRRWRAWGAIPDGLDIKQRRWHRHR